MKGNAMGRKVSLLTVIFSVLLLSACASPETKENTIEGRVEARWDTLLKGDLAAAYEFLSPGYRSSVSSLQYQRSILIQKIRWTGAEYSSHVCEETTCNVRVTMDFSVYGALPGVKSFEGTQVVEETWVQVGGQWYFVPSQ